MPGLQDASPRPLSPDYRNEYRRAPVQLNLHLAGLVPILVPSHVNDSGFWLVSRYLGMSEKQTLRVWTVMETIVGLTGFGVVLALSLFL